MLEFTLLSRLLGAPRFERAARRATTALWARRSPLGLVGNHINIDSGTWTHQVRSSIIIIGNLIYFI
jgi:hypothetical protein